jgi:hypothetical protein
VNYFYQVTTSLPDRFSRLKALQRPGGNPPARIPPKDFVLEPVDDTPEPLRPPGASAEELAYLLGAIPKRTRYGEHLSLRCWFPGPGEPAVDAAALRLAAPGACALAADPQQWLFLDTETTGLSGGTGTYAFLVGLAWWEGGGIEVEQLFMRDPGDEASLLLALAERLAERRVLVTFNGKAFDWPLLETRYRMLRKLRPPAPLAHLDMLHPARNIWRLRLGSVRLQELEAQVLGQSRDADVASALIPGLYFNFVRGGPGAPLVPVFLHNQMDLRGLAALACHILAMLAEPEAGQEALDLYGISRLCERRGEMARARHFYDRSLAGTLPAATERAARQSLARLAKRDGDFTRACELWESTLGNSREGLEAYEQLAIYYEHRAREPLRAAALVREALAALRQACRLGTLASAVAGQFKARLERRLERLEKSLRQHHMQAVIPR